MSDAKRVLIVEDEPNVRLVFSTALQSEPYAVATADDAEAALKALAKEPSDIVLLDLHMPGMGGMEMLRKLRESENNVPVVIISAHDQAPNVVQAMRLGAIDFLPKPIAPDALRKIVAEVLTRNLQPAKPGQTPPTGKPTPPTPSPDAELMAQAKAALNHREFGEADTLLKAAVKRPNLTAEAHYLMGIIKEMQDDKDGAYREYQAALRANPKFEPAKLHVMKYFNDRLM